MTNLNFPDHWLEPLGKAFCKEFICEIEAKIFQFLSKNVRIFPPFENIFRAMELVQFSNARVLILGQDPYHGFGQANGLSFSVNKDKSIPPSLNNIFHELKSDLEIPISFHGDLTSWAKQNVLLLNSSLTVEESKPGSHEQLGWNKLTNRIISKLSKRGEMIFVLWGNFAKTKIHLIDQDFNHILTSPHPSPLSAHRGFFGCKHFSKINNILIAKGFQEINWKL